MEEKELQSYMLKTEKNRQINTILNILIFISIWTVFALIMYRLHLLENKVDFRYFNVTTSMEDIHDVHINTKDGHLFIVK